MKRLLYHAALIALLLLAHIPASAQICRKDQLPAKYQQSLLAWYPFCNNTLDASGNGNHGTVSGNTSPAGDRYLRPNTAWYFSGDKCESRMDAEIKGLDTLNKLSLSFWIKREGNGCENPRIFEFWPGSDAPGHCVTYMRNGENKFGFQHRTSTNYLISKEFAFPKDDWMFFSYTNDGVFARFYINCIIIDSVPTQGKPILAKNVSFGRMNHPLYDAFNGKMDEIMIHGLCFDAGGLGGLYGLCDDPAKPFNVFPDTTRFCNGTPLLDAGPDAEAYVWSTNATTRTILPKASGWYNVMVSKGYGCDLYDTTYALLLKADIKQKDTAICKGTSLRLNIDSLFPVLPGNTLPKITARWSTGQTGYAITVNPQQTTTIFVNVTDGVMSCIDTIRIVVIDPGSNNPLKDQLNICEGNTGTLDAGLGFTSYLWNTGAKTQTIKVKIPGLYKVSASIDGGCLVSDSILVGYLPPDSCRALFVDITKASALDNFQHVMQVLDADNDFDDDLLVHNNWPSASSALPSLGGYKLLKNNGGGSFTEFPSNGGLAFTHVLYNATNADLDNNGFQDLVLFGADSLSIFRNANASFTDMTIKAGFGNKTISGRLNLAKDAIQAKMFADVNQDGLLDLVAVAADGTGSKVYGLISKLDCETGFVKFDSTAVLVTSAIRLGGINFADLDNDFDMDMLLLEYPNSNQYQTQNYKVHFNNGKGIFALNSGTGINAGRVGAFGVSGDFNNDGRADVVSAPSDCCVGGNPIGIWFSAPAFPYVMNQTAAPRVGNPYYGGTTPFDFNLDGMEDILWRNLAATGGTQGAKVQLHLNNADNTFTESAARFNINYGATGNCCPITVATQTSLLDYNADGKMDLFIESNAWATNTASQQGRWLLRNSITRNHINIRLQACAGARDGTGARIRYKADGEWYNKLVNYSSNQAEPLADYITLGLGEAATVDSIEVMWVGGARTYLLNQAANRNITINENANCPRSIPKPLVLSLTVAANKPSICVGEELVLTANPVNGGDNPAIVWRLNGNNTGTTGNTFKSKGFKNNDVVTAILTNTSSCLSNTTATSNAVAIKVDICVDDVFVPNTFTPNGDGKNDVLKVFGTYQQSTLSVYNQWGQLLFTGDGSIGWDGRHKGVMQPNGTYVYVAEVVVTGQRTVTKKGNVNLIR